MTQPRPTDRDTMAISLKDAARHFGFTVSTLRAEAARGHLTLYKIGKRYCTTPADIREMQEKCRVEPRAPGFTVTRRAASTSSETARVSYGLAEEALENLRNSYRNTSPASIAPRRARGR